MVKTGTNSETPKTPPQKRGTQKKTYAAKVTPTKTNTDAKGDTGKKQRKKKTAEKPSPKKTVSISIKRIFLVRFLLLLFIGITDTNIFYFEAHPNSSQDKSGHK